MGFNDWIRDAINYGVGGATNYGQEGYILRGRLVDMSAEKPYAAAALAKIDELSANGLEKPEFNTVVTTFMKGLSDHVKTLPPEQQFATFRDEVSFLAGGETAGMLATFDKAPPHVQQALMNAVTNNPQFIDHITQNGTGAMASLLTEDNLKAYGNQIADILNTIANKPGAPEDGGYDFNKLDKLGADAKAYFEEQAKGKDADAKKLAELQKALMGSVADAGGNIPPLMNMDLEKFMKFLHNLMNGDMNAAIDGLGRDLGMEGEQLAQFRDLMEMPAGILKFMGQDYYEFAMYYGPRAIESGTEYVNVGNELMNGKRVEFTGDQQQASADIAQPTQVASADYSDMKFTSEVNATGNGLAGVTKMTDGTSNDYLAGKGITPNVTPEQQQAVAAYDAQTSALKNNFAPALA